MKKALNKFVQFFYVLIILVMLGTVIKYVVIINTNYFLAKIKITNKTKTKF